jgi:cyclopropane fatty-acyl-phospholipid synthase-like methyltransferase
LREPFDKYKLYHDSVQSPDSDVRFFSKTYQEVRRKKAHSFREDFCGTFAISCEWVKLDKENHAIGLDLDREPIHYGHKHNASKLKEEQRKRLTILQKNVLTANPGKVDIIAAMNFSYYLFKKREQLRHYFARCHAGLKKNGLFFADCFGGPACGESNEEVVRLPGFKYFWDQESFDPITSEAVFHIHFQRKGERKRKYQFTYDWRMWTIPELREIMREAGFKRTHVYWEGTARNGSGNGIFRRKETGEECDAWVAYVVGEK